MWACIVTDVDLWVCIIASVHRGSPSVGAALESLGQGDRPVGQCRARHVCHEENSRPVRHSCHKRGCPEAACPQNCMWQNAQSWGASTPMKMCIQADLDDADALRHMNKNNSERAVCITHPLAPISTSFLFVFDTEWVMSTRSIRAEISCCRLV